MLNAKPHTYKVYKIKGSTDIEHSMDYTPTCEFLNWVESKRKKNTDVKIDYNAYITVLIYAKEKTKNEK
jgi:hypothetical protein